MVIKVKIIKDIKRFDYILIIFLLLLCGLGALFVYSASNYVALKDYDDRYYFVKKQLIGYFIGFSAFLFFSLINVEKLKKVALPFFCVSILLLILVLTPLGKEAYGAKRWIGIGGLTIQPSELARLAFVIFSASYFSEDMGRVKSFRGMLPVLLAGAITCVLIIAEPNMSVTICMGALMMVILFISGVKIKHLALMLLPVLIAIPLLIVIEPYRLKRLMAFLDPWASPRGEGYQLIQSLYGLGAGGMFGVGLFNSTQKLLFLPFSESDFILSIIGEETGFFGIVILFLICAVIIWRCINIAVNSKSFFTYLLCMGIAALFTIQIVVNALVVTGSIPPTGIPFPLVSSGNTQILTFMSAFGIVNSVHKNTQLTKIKAFA